MTRVVSRVRENGKVKIVPLGKNKLKEVQPRETLNILARRAIVTREALKRRKNSK